MKCNCLLGYQGNVWRTVEATLTNISRPFVVYWIATKGTGDTCDIALDDIYITVGSC